VILGLRDIKLRYRQTALGVSWVVFQPLMGALIFAFVFGRVAKLQSGNVPYFLFALVGMVAWGAFAAALTRTATSLLQNSAMISKVFFPRLVLPLSTLLAVLLDLLVGLALIALSMLAFGIAPSWRLLTLPLWLLLLLAIATGCGLLAAALSVTYRDVQHVLPVFVQLAFYATPVAYPAAVVPEQFRQLFLANPLASLFEAIRWSIVGSEALPVAHLLAVGVVGPAALWIGAAYFRHAERAFADLI
jgi:lipopolysaccharide transport system permease protein